MAKLFLDTTDTSYKVSNSNTEIFGANGTQAITIDGALTGIVLDANVERVAFSGTTSDYKYKQVGTDLEVYNAAGVLVTKVGLQDDTNGTLLTFANGTVDAKFAPSTTGLGLTVGGQAVATTAPTAVTIPAANIDVVTFPITAPTLSVASVAATATEGTNAIWTVTLANPATTATTVKYTLTNVAGASNEDTTDETVVGAGVTSSGSVETAPNSGIWEGTLTFAAGATTATLSLPVALDGLAETGEGVSLSLSNPSTNAIVNEAGKSATVSFVDAPATTFTLTSTGTGVEVQEGSTITFTVTPNSAVNANTTLVLNVQGKALGAVTSTASAADFEASPSITFAQGDTAPKTITLKVATDTAVEGREAYAVDVIDTTAYASRGNQLTGVITDKLPLLSLTQNVSTVAEGSTVTYTVTSDTPAPTGGITIPFTVAGTATSGTDYTALTASSITIAAGATTGSVTLSTIADTFTDGADETVIVTLGTAANASVSETAKTVTTTVTDSSKALGTAEMTLTGATSVNEGSTVTYTVTLGANATTALSIPYTLTGTATSGTDFTGSTGTISVAAGAKTGTLTLTTTADATTETAETVTLTLGSAGGFVAASGQGAVTTTINDTSVSVTGSTFAFTTAPDNFTGTTGNDTFNGVVDSDASSGQTLTVADAMNGGDGVDTANILFDTAAATTFPTATISNVEIFNLRSISGNALAVNALVNVPGATQINADRSTDVITVTNLASGASAGMIGNASTTNAAFNAGWVDAATTATLNVSSGTTAGNVALTGAGVTSTVINTTGTVANTIGTVSAPATSTSLTINANSGLKTGAITSAAATSITVNGAASTGVTPTAAGDSTSAVQLGTLPATVTTINASGLTSGGVAATLIAGITGFTGGQGNDTVTTFALTSTTASIINAGAGSADRLIVGTASDISTATKAKQYAGFEVLDTGATTTTVDASLFTNSTINALMIGASAVLTNVSATQAAAATVYANASPSITVSNATNVGQLDTLSLTVSDGLAAVNTITLGNITAAGVETINLIATDNVTVSSLTGASALTGMTITGAGNVSITSGALAANVNTSINASAVTGTVTVDVKSATGNGFSVTGSATKVNTLTGSSQADALTGGAAADTIQNQNTGVTTSAGDILAGGAGFDTFYLLGSSASAAGYTGSSRITDFTVGTTTTTTDFLKLTATIANMGGTYVQVATGLAAAAAGATGIQSLAQNASAAYTAGGDMIKLTTGVAAGASLQATFNSAIGTGTITGLVTGDLIYVAAYDTTNSKMIVMAATPTAGTATQLETGDTVTLVGTLDMTATDYAAFSNASLIIA